MNTRIVTLTALLAATGCLGAEPDAPDTNTGKTEQALTAPTPAPTSTSTSTSGSTPALTSTNDTCRALMQRQRACSDTFIPALVQARVDSDNPAGITAEDGSVGRPTLIKQAFSEWAIDSQDSAIDPLCEEIAQSVSPAKDAQLRASASACLAKTDCDDFVACAVPISLIRWKE